MGELRFALIAWAISVGATSWARAETVPPDAPEVQHRAAPQPRSDTIDLAPGMRVRVSPGATYHRLAPATLHLSPAQRLAVQVIALDRGRLDVTIERDGGATEALVVRGPGGFHALCIHGQAIYVAGPRGVAFANLRGDSRVGRFNRWSTLAEQHRHVLGGGKAGERRLLRPPELTLSRRVWLATDGTARIRALRWNKVRHAEFYEVSVRARHEPGFEQILTVRGEMAPVTSKLAPGVYEVRVRSVDRLGLQGAWSAPETVHVLGLELPPGAFIDSQQVIRLGPGQRVLLRGTEGLEMALGSPSFWVAAMPSLGLLRDALRRVYLRHPNDASVERLTLGPRQVQAKVHVLPREPRWPGEAIRIGVELLDSEGRPIDGLRPVTHVTVGLRPIAMQWQRHGSVYWGTVPAQPGSGPWVVRIEVTDQFGVPAGRDFVEVVGPNEVARAWGEGRQSRR